MTGPTDVFGAHVPMPRPGDPVAEILVVCHANIARSPLAMAMLEAEARARLGRAADVVWVRSAGVRARDGHPAASESARQAAQRGLDLGAHRSAMIDRAAVASGDLVLTMTESQRTDVARLVPGANRRTFTLPEFARLCGALPPVPGQESLRAHVRAVVDAADRARAYVPRPATPEDVADPFGGPREGYARTAIELEALVAAVADRLFPPSAANSPAVG